MKKQGRDSAELLRQRGYRLTPQRLLILEAVQATPGHISAEDIHRRVLGKYAHLNISTVYRTLELFRTVGLVTETDLGEGRYRWHYAEKGHHHHLLCEQCGALVELEESFLDSLQQALQRSYGFQANLSHFVITGRCRRCS